MKAPDKIYISKLVMAGAEILDKPVSDDDVEYIHKDLIKTEIERQIEEHKDWSSFYHSRGKHSDFEKGAIFALDRMLHFIDNLCGEKSARQRLAEWSKTPEGRESYEKVASEMRMELALDEEVKNYFKDWVDEDTDSVHNGCAINDSNQYVSLCDCARIARHFAQWGANHTPLPEDTVLFQKGVAEGKRLMMQEAVEGEVCIPNAWVEYKEGKELVVRAEISKELGFKFGDKVKIIIVKEDKK